MVVVVVVVVVAAIVIIVAVIEYLSPSFLLLLLLLLLGTCSSTLLEYFAREKFVIRSLNLPQLPHRPPVSLVRYQSAVSLVFTAKHVLGTVVRASVTLGNISTN